MKDDIVYQWKQIMYNEFYIKNVENPSEELQMTAVGGNPMAIKYIESPTERICFEAVVRNGKALKYIKNQTVEMCKAAVLADKNAIYYVKKECLTEEFYKEAIKVWNRYVCDYMPYEYCENILMGMCEEWGEKADEWLRRDIESYLRVKKVFFGEQKEAAVAMIGSVVEDAVADGERMDSHLFCANMPSWGKVYVVGAEQLEPQIKAKVVGLAEMRAFLDKQALILCPVDKTLSKKEILGMLRGRREDMYGIYIDNEIA